MGRGRKWELPERNDSLEKEINEFLGSKRSLGENYFFGGEKIVTSNRRELTCRGVSMGTGREWKLPGRNWRHFTFQTLPFVLVCRC